MKKLFFYLTFVSFLYSCSSSLNYIESEELINNYYLALSNHDIKYQVEHSLVKTIEKYGKTNDAIKYFERKIPKKNNDNSKQYTNISNLSISEIERCGTVKYYLVSFSIRSAQFAPYFNNESEEFIQKSYGSKNYFYNKNSKILEITETNKKVIILDTDKKWKVVSYDLKNIENGFGTKVSECILK